MLNKLKPREVLGTVIQLMVFALLIPFIAIVLGIIMKASPAAKKEYADAVLSFLPLADPIQNIISGLNLAKPGASLIGYVQALFTVIEGNFIAAMYIGMWQYAFRYIFRELIPEPFRLPGLPILQVVCGLLLSALTFPMLHDSNMKLMVTAFLIVLNIVLTLICVKEFWKKMLEIFCNLGLQSYLAAITIGYIASLVMVAQGYFTNLTQTLTCLGMCTLLLLVYLITQYLLLDQ
ncbi:MAG: hypothetical protein IKK75_09585 [Clostridia bacterium]|nr:hypothetical protein [Clostridia bacterium]